MPTNWAGNVTFTPLRVHRPTSLDELRRLVAGADRVHALGTGHSFSRVADTDGVLVSVADLPRTTAVDRERSVVAVSAGSRYGELAQALQVEGLALHNLGSLPHISVGGACATGTHGSGNGNGCQASSVAELELVTASGDLVRLARGDADLDGAVVALGALGVVTRLWLAVEPAYDVRQAVWERLPWDVTLERLDDVMAAGYSVSLFTGWRGQGVEQVWVKQRADETVADLAWTGAVPADGPRHPVPGMPVEHCTEQGGVAGPWHERLPHFRLGFTPSSGEELQTEYLVDRRHGRAALDAVDRVRDVVAPVLQVSELRSVAADRLWLSPAYERDSLAVHFTWVADAEAVRPAVAAVEEVLAPYDPRPHWGKVFGTDARDVRRIYPRLDDFRLLAARLDPEGCFRNAFVDEYVLG